jgi:hypothetical protein
MTMNDEINGGFDSQSIYTLTYPRLIALHLESVRNKTHLIRYLFGKKTSFSDSEQCSLESGCHP